MSITVRVVCPTDLVGPKSVELPEGSTVLAALTAAGIGPTGLEFSIRRKLPDGSMPTIEAIAHDELQAGDLIMLRPSKQGGADC